MSNTAPQTPMASVEEQAAPISSPIPSSTIPPSNPGSASVFRPSEYSALIVEYILTNRNHFEGKSVCDVGCGAGILLAAAGQVGAASLAGCDIESSALLAARETLEKAGSTAPLVLHQGGLWEPFQDVQFDVVVANLPHFPTTEAIGAERLPSWAIGGPNGRALIDPFLHGVAVHLAPGGIAVMAHNRFVDMDRTFALCKELGLTCEIEKTITVHLPESKIAVANLPSDLCTAGVSFVGGYAFAEVHRVVLTNSGIG